HRLDGSARDRQCPALDLLRRRRCAPVADDVGSWSLGILAVENVTQAERRRIEEDLRYGAAVHVHLLVLGLIQLDIDHHRRGEPRYPRPGEGDPAHELPASWMAARRRGARVPD